MSQPVNFIQGDAKGDETDFRDALPINMTAVLKPILGASGYMLQWPGLDEFATVAGVTRGGIYNERQSKHFRVSGESLQEIDENGNVTTLGTVFGADTVSLPYSFNTQAIIALGRMYLYNTGSGFVEVTDPDLGNPIDGVWINGYYFMTDGDFLFHTDITDETAIDPLKFATSEFSPDPTLGIGKTQDNKAIAFNRYTTEYFVDAASENFAFTRIESRALKIGIVGTHAKAELNDKWYIMGGKKETAVGVYALGIGSSAKISSREVDKIIGLYDESRLSTCVVEAYSEDDYSFLIVHLPDYTLIFNEKAAQKIGVEKAWSVLTSYIRPEDGTEWRAKHGVFEPRIGKWVFGDKVEGKLAILDETLSTHYGSMAEWVLFTPFFYLNGQSVDEFEVETVPGFTATDDATVFLSMTYDGVHHGMEVTMQYGGPSEYGQRFILRALGHVSDWAAIKLRGVSRSRMAFARGFITSG